MISLSSGRSRISLYLLLLGIIATVLAGFAVPYVDAGLLGPSQILTTELWSAVVVSVVVATTAVLVRRYLPFVLWSPIYGFVVVYLVLGSAGYIYYRLGTNYLGSFYDISVPRAQLAEALLGFFVALASFLGGALVYLLSSRRFKRLRRSKARHQAIRGVGPVIRPQSRGFGALSFAALLVPLLLFAIGKGTDSVWHRYEYLVEQHHFAYVLGALLSLPVLLAIGYILPARKSPIWRVACVAFFILYEVLFLSLSSRRFVVAPLFFIVGLAFGGARRRTIGLLLLTWTLALPLLSNVALALRGMPEQGLIVLPSNLSEIFAQDTGAEYFLAAETLIMNITFGVPLAGYVKNAALIPLDRFLVSVNPLPSIIPVPGLPSWGDFSDQVRVSEYMPFNALGELLNQGWLWLIAYYAVVGLVAAWVDIGARAFEGQRSRWGFLVACGMLDLFAITSTQYNLRTATRLIYYAVLVAIMWKVACRLWVAIGRGGTLRPGETHMDKQVRGSG